MDKISHANSSKNASKNRPGVTTVPTTTLRLVLSYLDTHSIRLKRNIIKLFKNQLPSRKLEIVFKTTQRMSSCFRFKNAVPRSLLSDEICEFKCPRCNSRYIGSTFRYWEKRLEEAFTYFCFNEVNHSK